MATHPPLSPKPHREFFTVDPHADGAEWVEVPTAVGRIEERVLASNLDPEAGTGSLTRLVRWSPGTLLDRPVRHAFHEEVFIVEGDLVVGCDAQGRGGQSFGPYTFACRPPGVDHGPFVSRGGCLMFEIQSFTPTNHLDRA